MARIQPVSGKFFILDTCCFNLAEAIVEGPFDTAAAAESEREQINIGEDCVVGECYAAACKLTGRPVYRMRPATV